MCTNRQCLFPKPCKNLNTDHKDYLELLRKLRNISGVKKVFIRSGIRFDYVNADTSSAFLDELAKYHVSGQLRVAPEHVSDEVLYYMGKPEHAVYQQFLKNLKRQMQGQGKAVCSSVSYVFPSGVYYNRSREAGRVCAGYGIYAGAGTGFLSYAVYDVYLYVLHRDRPKNRKEGLCTENLQRKSHAEGFASI